MNLGVETYRVIVLRKKEFFFFDFFFDLNIANFLYVSLKLV
jgi:hypothetical protein